MIGLDTNVLVRLITRDDPEQTSQAQRLLRGAEDNGLYISLVVLAELAWVLRRAYRYELATVLKAIELILDGREFFVERRQLASRALANARAAGCGYADALIELLSLEAGASVTVTFDIKAKRLASMREVSVK